MVAASLFPNGIARYAIGGALIGSGVAFIYLTTGIIAGASTFLESTLSYVSDVPRFNRGSYVVSRDWRVLFTVGIVLGAAVYAVLWQGGAWTTDVQWWRLLGGGFLVGIGTRLGKGCTSGHGVCGVGSMSPTSLVNVATFMAVAIGTAQLVAALGVSP
ncbi:MAG: YeeE/YedE family protein [Halorientalis sp.]